MSGAATSTNRVSQSGYTSSGYALAAHQSGWHGSQSSTVGEGQIISERIVEHEVRIPKKVIREDIVEKVIIIPEKVLHEEITEDISIVREKIVEVAKSIIHERIVEVPEYEYIEKLVEVPEVVLQEKIREVPRIEYQERITQVPKIITQERIVEVPEIEYREVPYEKIVEVPEVHEQTVLKHIPVPQYVDRPVPEYVNVEVEQDVTRHIPVPIETITTINLTIPRMRPRYTVQDVPLYVPRFIEVALPAELMEATAIAEAEHYAQQVAFIASQNAVSLCEIERLAGTLKDLDVHYSGMMTELDVSQHLSNAWTQGGLNISVDHSMPTHSMATCGMESRSMVIKGRCSQSSVAGFSFGESKVPTIQFGSVLERETQSLKKEAQNESTVTHKSDGVSVIVELLYQLLLCI